MSYAWFFFGCIIVSLLMSIYTEITDGSHGLDLSSMESNGFFGGWLGTFMSLWIIGTPIYFLIAAITYD